MRTVSLVVFLALIAACGPGGRDTTDAGGGGGGDGGSQDDCSDAARSVYVVDSNNKFSRFEPSTKTFVDLGNLSCPAQFLATPFSMGVDRDAVAWVLYSSGELFRVDTATLQCTKSTWTSQGGLSLFGMGFSTTTVGGTTDALFVAGGSSPTATASTLATLSTQTFTAQTLGTVQGWPELTGTGNAELWGWFPDASAPRVEQINKGNGAAVKTLPLPSLAGEPAAWAFAFWGGDFWIFLMRGNELSTTVYQIDGTTGAVKGSTPAPGRTIVGAGVSTCAPVVIL
jgi:hypothetical protein